MALFFCRGTPVVKAHGGGFMAKDFHCDFYLYAVVCHGGCRYVAKGMASDPVLHAELVLDTVPVVVVFIE